MRFVEPPTVGTLGAARSGDELDRLLNAYFQAEMPHPWPELEPPAPLSVPSSRLVFWTRIKRSHLALAASVALLIGGSLAFGGKLPSIGQIFKTDEVGKDEPKDHELRAPKHKDSIEVDPDGNAAIRIEMEDRY